MTIGDDIVTSRSNIETNFYELCEKTIMSPEMAISETGDEEKEIEDKISIFEKVWTNHLSQAKEPVSEKFLESGYDIVKQSMSLSNGDSKLIIAGFTIAKFLKPDNKHRDIQGMTISYAVKILENYSENFESETIPLFRISMSTLYKIITTETNSLPDGSNLIDCFSFHCL